MNASQEKNIEKNLIIADSPKVAAYIAAALYGIVINENEIITYDDLDTQQEKLSDIMSAPFFKTKFKGVSTSVTWLTGAFLQQESPKCDDYSLSDLPIQIETESFSLTTENTERLVQKKGCQNVYFAFSPGILEDITKDVIREKIFKNATFYDIKINTIQKDSIKLAFNEPMTNVSLNGATTIAKYRHLLTSTVTKNLSAAIKTTCSIDIEINQYMLLCLFLLKNREERVGQRKFTIYASININGTYCTASSNFAFSESDAKSLIKELPDEITSKGFANSGLPTVSTLFKLYNHGLQNPDIKKIASSLYEKGYISQPLTLNSEVMAKSTKSDFLNLLNICSSFASSENPLPTQKISCQILNRLTNKRYTAEHLSAIVPKQGTLPLSEAERLLYQDICSNIVTAIQNNENQRYEFSAKTVKLFARLPSIMDKDLRPKKKWPVTYELKENGTYSAYTPFDLIREFEKRMLGTPDIYIHTFEALLENKLIKLDGNNLFLTEKAKRLFSQLPFDMSFISLCTGWESSLIKIERGTASYTPSHFMANVNSVIHKWISDMKKNTEEKQISRNNITENSTGKGASASPIDTNSNPVVKTHREPENSSSSRTREPLLCPRCHTQSLDLSGQQFICNSCGIRYQNYYEYEGFTFLLRTKDILSLIEFGKTSLKIARNGEDYLAGFLILDKNKEIAFTNRSTLTCPYCGADLYVYDWGYACERCAFNVPFIIHSVRLDKQDMSLLLAGKMSNAIKGLRFNNGEEITAHLQIAEDGTLKYFKEEK